VLFQKLPVADLMTEHGVAIEPGVVRSREVSVGRHVAPNVASLDACLGRAHIFLRLSVTSGAIST